jgi:predicted Zn-dependent protease
MLKGFLYHHLLWAILVLLIILVLYGVVPVMHLAAILLFFVMLRILTLMGESRRESFSGPQMSLPVRSGNPPRPKRELCAEALGVIAFAFVIPLDIALYTRDFFSVRTSLGWEGTVVAALCVLFYLWPHFGLKSPDLSDVRIWWWTLPFFFGFLALFYAIEVRHPYLNPLNPDRDRLAAEKILSLKDNVLAGRYADWVVRYARQLDAQWKFQQAIHFYQEGVRLNPTNRAAYERLSALEAKVSGKPVAVQSKPAINPSAPYWTADKPIINLPRHSINSDLENVWGCTVVIVAVGDVPDKMLDSVGTVIHDELGLPVCVAPDSVPLPPYTRRRGLATDPQWDETSIFQAFSNAVPALPPAPIKYVLITPADIYWNDDNYVFSISSSWGAVVSYARFGGGNTSDYLLRQRTAKQTLGALIKSFGVPASTDRNCVTSYTQDLEEFDAKGNRPNAETMRLFQEAVAAANQRWQNHRATSGLLK